MRQIVATCALAGGIACALLLTIGTDQARAQSKAKAIKAAVPNFGNAEAISEEELKVYSYFLASDQLEGRNFPSRGYDTAALYVASHLAEWGLKPAGSTDGTTGPLQPFLMPIDMVSRQVVPEESKASLTAPAVGGGRGGFGGGQGGGARQLPQLPAMARVRRLVDRLRAGGRVADRAGVRAAAVVGRAAGRARMARLRNCGPRISNTARIGRSARRAAADGAAPLRNRLTISGNLVFAGNGYVINKTKTNPYEGIDVKGKIIVVAGLPEAARGTAGGGSRRTRRRSAATSPIRWARTAPTTGAGAVRARRTARWRW